MTGKVYLIGAGPGDPKLLTLRAVEALRESNVILIDHLVNRAVLRHARATARVIDGGKRAGHPCISQEEIHRMMIARARSGQTVARLKGGDPFVFGRGGEEAEALTEAGVEWEVIPGISSGIAAAAYAGIPLLHREHSSSVAFVSGHPASKRKAYPLEADTLVIFMCGSTVLQIARELVSRGRPHSTPVAIIRAGTYSYQEVYTGTLAQLSDLDNLKLESPVLAVVGKVVDLAETLHWFGRRPRPVAFLALEDWLIHSDAEEWASA